MTRKDFKLIAEVVSKLPALSHKEDIAEAFSTALATTNPRFNKNKFIEASLNKN